MTDRNGCKYATAALIGLMAVGLGGCGEGQPCGPGLGLLCVGGTYCKLDDATCNDNLAVGVCTTPPDVCTEEFVPVCGCDGQTYSNSCMAEAAGVNIDHQGECAGGTGGNGTGGGSGTG